MFLVAQNEQPLGACTLGLKLHAHKVVKDAISYAHIQSNNAYYKEALS
jgi:hypothetical protein